MRLHQRLGGRSGKRTFSHSAVEGKRERQEHQDSGMRKRRVDLALQAVRRCLTLLVKCDAVFLLMSETWGKGREMGGENTNNKDNKVRL